MKFGKNISSVDRPLLIVVGLLFAIGMLMLYSASAVESFKDFNNTTYYITHQLMYGGLIGLIGFFICLKIDYHQWKKIIPLAIFGSLLLLVLVKVPGVGFSANGATRWIHFGPIVFQPAEIAKLAIIMYIAGWVSKRQHSLGDFVYGILPTLIITGLFALLILWQPDVGTMLVLILTALVMLFTAGIDFKYFLGLVVAGFFSLLAIIKLEPYRTQRLVTFLNPSHDPQGIGYQINQALLAIGAGGLWGYGYGLSRQKHNYLPETLGDSIFAVTAEELGFLRLIVIITLFCLLTMRGLKIAQHAPDIFGKMLALGITATLGLQVIINIGAIVGLLPLTGIPLPFFSYGSSALIITLCEIGILLNVSKQARL